MKTEDGVYIDVRDLVAKLENASLEVVDHWIDNGEVLLLSNEGQRPIKAKDTIHKGDTIITFLSKFYYIKELTDKQVKVSPTFTELTIEKLK